MLEEERLRVGARETRAIDPGEIGRLDVRHRQAKARFDEVAVAAQVVDLRREPFVSLAQRGERSVVAENRARGQYMGVQLFRETFSQV